MKRKHAESTLIVERLENMRELLINVNSTEQIEIVRQQLTDESKRMQTMLADSIGHRTRVNLCCFPSNAVLTWFACDTHGQILEQPVCLVNNEQYPMSDPMRYIRLPTVSDCFHITADRRQLTIIDDKQQAITESITFKQLTDEIVEFAYVNNDKRTVIVSNQHSICQCLSLNVQTVPFEHLIHIQQPTGMSREMNTTCSCVCRFDCFVFFSFIENVDYLLSMPMVDVYRDRLNCSIRVRPIYN
jgi:hypothetical protein